MDNSQKSLAASYVQSKAIRWYAVRLLGIGSMLFAINSLHQESIGNNSEAYFSLVIAYALSGGLIATKSWCDELNRRSLDTKF